MFTTYKNIPPVAISLRRALGRNNFIDSNACRPVDVLNFDIRSNQEQFDRIDKYTLQPKGSAPHGLVLAVDLPTNWAYVTDT